MSKFADKNFFRSKFLGAESVSGPKSLGGVGLIGVGAESPSMGSDDAWLQSGV